MEAEVRGLLGRLRSWEELAVLLAVAIPDERENASTIGKALAVPEELVASAIGRLHQMGLLVSSSSGNHVVPSDDARSAIVALADAYARDPAGVLQLASALAMERARMSASVLMALEAIAASGRR